MSVRTYSILSLLLAVATGLVLWKRGSSAFAGGVDPGIAVLVTLGWIAGAYGLYRVLFSKQGDPVRAARVAILVQLALLFVGGMIVYVVWSFDIGRSVMAEQCVGVLDGWEASPAGAEACNAFPDESFCTLLASDLNDPTMRELRARYESKRSTEQLGWPYEADASYDIGFAAARICATEVSRCAIQCEESAGVDACFRDCVGDSSIACATTVGCLAGTTDQFINQP